MILLTYASQEQRKNAEYLLLALRQSTDEAQQMAIRQQIVARAEYLSLSMETWT